MGVEHPPLSTSHIHPPGRSRYGITRRSKAYKISASPGGLLAFASTSQGMFTVYPSPFRTRHGKFVEASYHVVTSEEWQKIIQKRFGITKMDAKCHSKKSPQNEGLLLSALKIFGHQTLTTKKIAPHHKIFQDFPSINHEITNPVRFFSPLLGGWAPRTDVSGDRITPIYKP